MSVQNNKKIAISFDLEFWHCGEHIRKYLPENYEIVPDIYKITTDKILNLLAAYNSQATFFVIGELAEKNLDLIKKIFLAGHEIAWHGFNHKLVYEMSLENFRHDLSFGQELIKNITGIEMAGFRAPNFSIRNDYLKILRENNFKYDSSRVGLRSKEENEIKQEFDIEEKSVSAIKIGKLIISLGGWYSRFLPYWFFSFFLKKIIKQNRIPIIYLHAIDLSPLPVKIKINPLIRMIKFWGVKKAWGKLERMLNDFESVRMDSIV